MSRMSELSMAVTELRRCGEAIIGLSETLRDLFSGRDESDTAETISKTEAVSEKPKPITLEAVRAVLAEKSRAGHTAEVRELLERHGAAKLSEIDPCKYTALLKEAEALGNG